MFNIFFVGVLSGDFEGVTLSFDVGEEFSFVEEFFIHDVEEVGVT